MLLYVGFLGLSTLANAILDNQYSYRIKTYKKALLCVFTVVISFSGFELLLLGIRGSVQWLTP